MNKVKIISNIGMEADIPVFKDCELFVDVLPRNSKSDCIRILWLLEPNFLTGIKDEVIRRSSEFDLILTWNQEILDKCRNSKLFPFSASWISNYEFPSSKQYCVTTLVGGKLLSYNHHIRQRIPDIRNLVTTIPIEIFNSKNYPCNSLKDYKQITESVKKNEMFYSQYHIAIENVTELNCFTEKLIDCFQTKTIPIYIGCPNIDKFFDTRGMLLANDLKDIINICNSITPETYNSKLEYVEKNYELSKKYTEYMNRMKNEVISFMEKL